MIRFYFHPTPNPAKIALFLEETGLPYDVIPVDTSKGEQHTPTFRAINPNGKVPAIVDTDGPGGKDARVFDSTAILLYLAEKPASFSARPRSGRNCFPGSCLSARGSVRSPVSQCISSSLHLRASITPGIGTAGRPSGITKC
jgi:glutathione S-transferase